MCIRDRIAAFASDRTHPTPRVDGHERGDSHREGSFQNRPKRKKVARQATLTRNRLISTQDAADNPRLILQLPTALEQCVAGQPQSKVDGDKQHRSSHQRNVGRPDKAEAESGNGIVKRVGVADQGKGRRKACLLYTSRCV